jgi:phosphatidylglycerophosphate synthase
MTPPNMVTLFRIATAPFLIWILMHTSPSASWLAAGVSPHVPAWMVVVLVTREIMVTGLRAVAAAEGLIVAAEELGKYKMALQAIAIHGLLIHYTYLHVDFFAAGMFILWLAMGVSVWSGIDYYVRVVRALTPKPIASSGKRAVI